MNTKITFALASLCKTMSAFDALKLVKAAGYDGTDFCLSVFSRPKDAPLRQDDWWRSWTQAVKTYADELQLPITQAHASWEQHIPQSLQYESPYYIYERTFEACHILGCSKLVFHPVLFLHRIEAAPLHDVIHNYNVRWFRELLPFAEKFGVTIELENTFDYYHVQKPGDPSFTYIDAEKMLRLCDALNSPLVKLCLDTGHANITGQNVPQMIRLFGSRLDCLHLNDNYGRISGVYEDLHLFPGSGRLPWREIMTALRETGYKGTLNMEVIAELPASTPEVKLLQMQAGRNVLRELAMNGGF